jgi:hypothetical protein
MDTLGLREAGTAQRNGCLGLRNAAVHTSELTVRLLRLVLEDGRACRYTPAPFNSDQGAAINPVGIPSVQR